MLIRSNAICLWDSNIKGDFMYIITRGSHEQVNEAIFLKFAN